MSEPRGSIHWNPMRLDGTELPEALLLAARLLAVTVVMGGEWPFPRGVVMIDMLGEVGTAEQFTTSLRLGACAGIVALLFTRWVRVGAALIGGSILIGLLGAMGAHSVAHTYLAAFFLIVGLSSRRVGTDLLRVQVLLLYGAGALHKTLDPDWWDGDYFHTFQVVRHGAEWLDHRPVLMALGLATIAMEWLLFVLFSRARTSGLAARVGIVFHGSIALITGLQFGPFLAALLASFLALSREGHQDNPLLLRPWVLLAVAIQLTEPHIAGLARLPILALLVIAAATPPRLLGAPFEAT